MFLLIIITNYSISQETEMVERFFNEAIKYQCFKNNPSKARMSTRYEIYDQENFKSIFIVPDSLEYSDFYNDYGVRIIHAFYALIKPEIIDSLQKTNDCKIKPVREKFVSFISNRNDFVTIYNSCFSHYSKKDSNVLKKDIQITKDSLLKIAVEFYSIDKVDTSKNHIESHFCSGNDPFSYNEDKYINIVISGFCYEALSTKTLVHNWSDIVNEYKTKLISEKLNGTPEELKIKLDKDLKKRMLNNKELQEIVMNYYNSRKRIEPFEIIE